MTTIRLGVLHPTGTAADARSTGNLEWVPTARRVVGADVVLPIAFLVTLSATVDVTVVVAPTSTAWVWRVLERVSGGSGGWRYLAVPDSLTPVHYADLVEVDPSSFSVAATPAPAWQVEVDAFKALGTVGSQGPQGPQGPAGSDATLRRSLAGQAFAQSLLAIPAAAATPVTQLVNGNVTSPVSVSAAAAGPLVAFKNGIPAIVLTNTSVAGWRNAVPYPQTSTGLHSIYAVEFDFRGLELAIRVRDNYSSNTAKLWVWVDGVPQTAEYAPCGTTPSGGIFNWRLTFGTTGLRRVKIYFHNCDFAGFNKTATSLIQPTPAAEPVMGILADSWGAGANGVLPGRTLLQTTALLLGCQVFMNAQEGTGYVTPSADATYGVYSDPRRLGPLATAPLNILVIVGSLNDDVNSDATPAAIGAAATATYAAWAALRPDVPIVVLGVQSTGTSATGDGNADRIANNAAVKAAALAAPNVLGFIDMLGEAWVTGTGNVGAVTNNGPADWLMASTYHPSQEGADLLARRAAAAITSILRGTVPS